MSTTDICFMTATELARCIRAKELSAREVMEAHLAQIERVNPKVNAIVTLLPERAMDGARAADDALARGEAVGPLHGLPIAHKDLIPTKGIRTTFGSPIYEDFVPDQDTLIVERMQAAGAITIGKTNTPEFGAGSQTFNEVFGATLNPYDLTKTCGGSSGGAAVALACGMVPIADGSDMGGSLRNPASFCNVVGFRPAPGRVPVWPSATAWSPLSVEGPMARTVADVALLLSAMAGPDRALADRDRRAGQPFRAAARPRLPRRADRLEPRPRRPAGRPARDGGDRRAAPRLRSARLQRRRRRARFQRRRRDLQDVARLEVRAALWRAAANASPPDEGHGHLEHRGGSAVSPGRSSHASKASAPRSTTACASSWRRYEFLICPVNQVPPFDVTAALRHRDQRRADGDLHRLDALVLLTSRSPACRPSRCPAASRRKVCRSACRSSGAIRMTRGAAAGLRVRAGDAMLAAEAAGSSMSPSSS